jgi:hypothetical protein
MRRDMCLHRREATVSLVAPAQAGAHGPHLDSRLRGNDVQEHDLDISGSAAGKTGIVQQAV